MSIKRIKAVELKGYKGREGLVLQGCGGKPKEWLDGINELFEESDILLDGTKFHEDDCAVFSHDDYTCILFEFNDKVNLNIGKLAMWRIQTHPQFGGTWLTDFVDNKLGGFESQESAKPKCELIGQDGNIYNLMGIAARTLRENGMHKEAKEMVERIHVEANNYDQALGIIGEYVEITGPDEADEDFDEDSEDFDDDYDEDYDNYEGMDITNV